MKKTALSSVSGSRGSSAVALPMSGDMGLQSLLDEPQRLANEADRLNVELESLVMDNYKVFVENLTCSKHLRAEDKKLGDVSGSLGKTLHDLSQQCFSFKDRVNQFVVNHKRNRKTLQHHMQLVELLEVPQLVDACARNGFHDEALELANFVNGLERRHLLASEVKSLNGKIRGGSGVIQNIVDEVHSTLGALRQQLLQQLTENVSLPQEIRILATLRKLDSLLIDRHLSVERHEIESATGRSLTDAERDRLRSKYAQSSEVRLQMDFLEARTIWLHRAAEGTVYPVSKTASNSGSSSSHAVGGATNAVSSAATAAADKGALGPYGRAIEMLEMRRMAWFAVITQFNALFQENTYNNSTGSKSTSVTPMKNIYDSSTDQGVDVSVQSYTTAAVMNAWATRQVNQLLRELQLLLPRIEDGASLRSVLEQTIYFASRMGQVGCDFSGLAIPLFQNVMLDRFQSELQTALKNFEIMLLTEKITFDAAGSGSGTGSSHKEQVIPLYAPQDFASASGASISSIETASISSSSSSGRAGHELPAPYLLMRFPPLAYLVNALLTTLNYIRECPIASVELPALTLLFRAFTAMCCYLAQQASVVRSMGSKYVNDSFLHEIGINKSARKKAAKDIAGAGTKVSSNSSGNVTMDALYAQALALDLLPHVLVCFDAIFQKNTSKLEARVGALKAKSAVQLSARSDAASNAGSSTSLSTAANATVLLPCLVRNLYDAKDVLDCDIVEQLSRVWAVLVSAGLLDKSVLEAEYVSSSAAATGTATMSAAYSSSSSASVHSTRQQRDASSSGDQVFHANAIDSHSTAAPDTATVAPKIDESKLEVVAAVDGDIDTDVTDAAADNDGAALVVAPAQKAADEWDEF